MGKPLLESSAVSAFCESVAVMLSAGIQTDEAVAMLAEDMEESSFKKVCGSVYKGLIEGKTLAESMEAAQAFPRYALDMVRVGEYAGRLENVLRSLSVYYDEENRLFAKVRSSIGYPAALLCVMSVIVLFTVVVILPVFNSVYENLSGSLTAGSFGAVGVSSIVGWVALVLVLLSAAIALGGLVASRSEAGRQKLMRIFERLPFTKKAMYQLALSRFTSALASYIASGLNTDDAMKRSVEMVDHRQLKAKLDAAYQAMIDHENVKNLAQAINDAGVFESVYARMMSIGLRSGGIEEVLESLSVTFFDDALVQIDRAVNNVEPALAAFMTVAVGATLVAVMLPLVGIMGSIG